MMEKVHLNWIENADRSEKLDYILFFTAVACCCLVGYLLAFDISLFTKPQYVFMNAQEPVANLVTSENTVSYKNSNLPIWNSTSKNQKLYLNDQIFTDSDSWAQIEFSNQVKLNVGQNSLIVVLKSERQNAIKLEQGTLYVNFDSPGDITVNLGSGDIKLSSSNKAAIELNARKDGSTSIASLRGNVKVSNRNKNIEFGKNSSTTIDAGGQLGQSVRIPISGMIPDHGSYISADKIEDTVFTWESEEELSNLSLLIARDQNFKDILVRSANANGASISRKLQEGHYYWRVNGNNAAGENIQSSTYKITIVDTNPPKAIYPAENQVFEIRDQMSVYFDWQKMFAANGYEFQLSSDRHFERVLKTISGAVAPLAIHSLDSGEYYWRIRTKYDRIDQQWSEANHFKIQGQSSASDSPALPKQPDETLAPPKLQIEYHIRPSTPKAKPLPKKEHSFLYDIFMPTAYAEEPSSESEIKWPAIEGAESYDLQLSRTEEFTDIVVEQNVSKPAFALNKLKNGKYFLRIRTVGKSGAKSPYSAVSVVYVVHPELKLISPVDGSNQVKKEKVHAIKFEWHPILGAEQYIFELSNTSSFVKPIISVKLKEHKTTRTFSGPGTYFWRIGYKVGGDETEYSQTNSFSLTNFGVKAPLLVKSIVVNAPAKVDVPGNIKSIPADSLSFPVVKLKKNHRYRIQTKWLPTRLESLSSLDYGKEKLKLTTPKSVSLNLQYRFHRNYGLHGDFTFLKSSILNDQSVVAKTSKLVIDRRFKPELYAETDIALRIGVAEKYIVGLAHQSADSTLIKTKKVNALLLGLSYGRALSEKYWLMGLVDYSYGLSDILSEGSYHFDTELSISRHFDSNMSIGLGYMSDFGQYNFKKDNTELEINKIMIRQQKIAFMLGWMM